MMRLKSQLRFAMHPKDELDFVAEVLSDDTVRLIDGPRWKASTPEAFRSIEAVKGQYCIIWSAADRPSLDARYVSSCDDWYCDSEQVTIQFLRCALLDSVLIEGRIAVNTTELAEEEAVGVGRRYKSLSRFLKKHYVNSVVQWWNPARPVGSGDRERSANPSKPDPQLWVGPHAMRWLLEDSDHCIKQSVNASVEARLATLASRRLRC